MAVTEKIQLRESLSAIMVTMIKMIKITKMNRKLKMNFRLPIREKAVFHPVEEVYSKLKNMKM